MVTPIFNTAAAARCASTVCADRGRAHDAGRQCPGSNLLTNVIIPLAKPGIAIGSIFVVTLVMGDFITVRFMSGGPDQLRWSAS